MVEFLEMINLFHSLFTNLVFGLIWMSVGIIITLCNVLIKGEYHESGYVTVKAIGFTIAAIFLIPGLVAIYFSASQYYL